MNTKVSPYMIVMAAITAALSTWGLYGLATNFAHMPGLLAVLAVVGFDVFAIACGKQALDVARDGDSSAPWNALLVLFAVLAAVMQYGHAILAGWPPLVGVMMAAFPIATVALFEGTLRRAYRLNGRRTGNVAMPRATFDVMTWLLYPRLAFQAMRMSVLDRGLNADTALVLAEKVIALARAEAAQPPRRIMSRSYAHLTGDGDVIEAQAVRLDTAADTEDAVSGQSTEAVRMSGSVSAAVRDAVTVHGQDYEAVRAAVRVLVPGAKDDAIRKAFARAGAA